MADIFNGGTVKLFYNLDTANQNVISSGNIEIENVATFPTFSISDSANKIETYDSEYTRTVVGDKAIGDLEIVVNYRPDSETHQFLDSAYDNKTEFQLIVNYIEDQDAGKVEAVIVSGNINSRMISGDKDDVVRMTYTYSPRTIISMGTRLIPPVLRRGDYGVGSDGTPDYPQYSPQEAEGNAFVMIPAADTDNPAGTDLYGIELVSQPMGQSNTNLMLTDSGDLRIYARNNTTPWSRVYTSGESDTLYLSKANNLSDLDNVITARSNLGILSTTENDARYMIGSRNLSELTDKDTALANLGIISLSAMDTRYLKTASNLSDLVDKASARSNLQVDSVRQSIGTTPGQYNAFTNPNASYELRIANNGEWRVANNETNGTSALSIGGGGTGALDVPNAKVNLQVDRLNQFGATTSLTSGNRTKSIIVNDDGTWGGYNETSQSYIPLGINNGGTGGWDVNSAKANLQVERLVQSPSNTLLYTSSREVAFTLQDGVWGAYKAGTNETIPLAVYNGGTGRSDGSAVFKVYETDGSASDGIKIKAPSGGNSYTCYANSSNIVKWRTGYNSTDDELNFYNYTNTGAYNTNPLKLKADGDAIVRRGVVAESLVLNAASYPRLELVSRDRTTAGDVGAKVSLEIPNSVNAPPYFVQRNLLNNTGQIVNNLPSIGGNLLTDNAPKLGTGINANEIYGFKSATFISAPTASTNLPFGGYGVIGSMGSSERTGSGSYSSQMCWDKISGAMYTRVKDDLTNAEGLIYTPWVRVTTSAVSDERLKNIKGELNVQGALDNINRMEFKIFTFKNDETQRARRGVIAQQVREIDKDYTWQVGEYLHLDPTPLILDGLAAIQALSNQNDSLVEKIEDQQQQIDELKALVQSLITK
ncbi:tail fiber domain-containing protein [Citrobacter sp. Cb010]|uniref:tail fiber domain-containing protein n=1 Tax=unclassified Citrobacter TaxID=2644389 RepID=UPI002574B1B0|nr:MULTISPECIES: tail fiber domain-containing protein [unclassified Citrobacter]MDM3376133.1 tail fiber domain-containing protein [Citrobacter sp. Cb010]MDM3456540.1 tail fiber domain-containing protein [Citrobacter sp. Cb036]